MGGLGEAQHRGGRFEQLGGAHAVHERRQAKELGLQQFGEAGPGVFRRIGHQRLRDARIAIVLHEEREVAVDAMPGVGGFDVGRETRRGVAVLAAVARQQVDQSPRRGGVERRVADDIRAQCRGGLAAGDPQRAAEIGDRRVERAGRREPGADLVAAIDELGDGGPRGWCR